MIIKQNCRPYNATESYEKGQLGSIIIPWHTIKKQKPKVAILGISNLDASTVGLQKIRTQLYNLYIDNTPDDITDLGDLISFNIIDISDLVNKISTYLLSNNIVLIVISAESDFVKKLNLDTKNENNNDNIYVNYSIKNVTDNLVTKNSKSKVSEIKRVIGTQIYFNPRINTTDNKLINFRISEIRNFLQNVEPEFRKGNFCHLDMNSIRFSDFPCNKLAMPNGLYGEEACRLAWFAGNSNSIKLYIQTEYTHQEDQHSVGAMLYSQIIWHFISGVLSRVSEDPYVNIGEFKEYYVNSEIFGQYVIFYKSRKTSKYWLKVPGNKIFLPCSENDMKTFVDNRIPNRLIENIKINTK